MVIAGASSGIGAATARHAAEAGYRVVLGARSEDKLQQLAEETGGIAVKCDVSEYAQVEAPVIRKTGSESEAMRLRLPGFASRPRQNRGSRRPRR